MASACSCVYPNLKRAVGTVLLTILITPPPTSFLYLISARSGSIPVVSQSIMNPMVPVGAITFTCALRYPERRPDSYASCPHGCAPVAQGAGLLRRLLGCT